MNYTDDHEFTTCDYRISINNIAMSIPSYYYECKYCKISKLYVKEGLEYPKCLTKEEKIIKDILE